MIAKLVKGRGFRGALEYDLDREKGVLLDTNMAGENPRELAQEFGAIRELRPGLGKAVFHASLSAAPGEHLSDEQWREIGQEYLAGMGFTEHQYVISRHTDTEHEHIHILANRIGYAGQVVSDAHDYPRQERLMREIEHEYGLQEVAPSQEAERRAREQRGVEDLPEDGVRQSEHPRAGGEDDRRAGLLAHAAERRDPRGVRAHPAVGDRREVGGDREADGRQHRHGRGHPVSGVRSPARVRAGASTTDSAAAAPGRARVAGRRP